MAKQTIIPFGPQHPVLPEPIHLDLVLEDELVVGVIPNIGFIHRGLELLCRKKDYQTMSFVAERICGICSVIHGAAYCQGIEQVMNVEIPERAAFLRVFWSELHRIHSHLLWAGLAADAIGFESLFMHTWRVREKLLDIFEESTGGRVILGVCQIGGVRHDIKPNQLQRFEKTLKEIEADFKELANVFMNDHTINTRWKEVGVVSKDEAYELGAVGPTARASGIAQDMRQLKYGAYEYLDFESIVETSCDCYGRAAVRIKEIFQSFDLARQAISKLPEGELAVVVKGAPEGEYFSRVEQPRGEVIHYVKGDGTQFLTRYRVRTPTFANIPAMVKMLEGSDLADVPAIILSIDPCISCVER